MRDGTGSCMRGRRAGCSPARRWPRSATARRCRGEHAIERRWYENVHVRHRGGEPQRVGERVVPTRIPGEPAPTDRLPKAVECTATMTGRPDRGPRRMRTCSWLKGISAVPTEQGKRLVSAVIRLRGAEQCYRDAPQIRGRRGCQVGELLGVRGDDRDRCVFRPAWTPPEASESSLPALNRHVQALLHVQIRPLSR